MKTLIKSYVSSILLATILMASAQAGIEEKSCTKTSMGNSSTERFVR